jgi:hypothetical protein
MFSDRRSAATTCHQLAITLARLGRHNDALAELLHAATTWRQLTGQLDSQDLAWLHRENVLAGRAILTC